MGIYPDEKNSIWSHKSKFVLPQPPSKESTASILFYLKSSGELEVCQLISIYTCIPSTSCVKYKAYQYVPAWHAITCSKIYQKTDQTQKINVFIRIEPGIFGE